MTARVVYEVAVQVAPESERAWETWYVGEHAPAVLREPGFLRAVLSRSENGGPPAWTEYFVRFEVETRAALEAYLAGDAAVRLRHDHAERFGEVTRVSRRILVPVAVLERGN